MCRQCARIGGFRRLPECRAQREVACCLGSSSIVKIPSTGPEGHWQIRLTITRPKSRPRPGHWHESQEQKLKAASTSSSRRATSELVTFKTPSRNLRWIIQQSQPQVFVAEDHNDVPQTAEVLRG